MLKPSSRRLSSAPPKRTIPQPVIVVSLGVMFGTITIMIVLLLHHVLAVHPLS